MSAHLPGQVPASPHDACAPGERGKPCQL